jgi:hypothetical protein
MDVLFVLATVAVAQLVEPWIVIPVVVGSSPISHPNPLKAKNPFKINKIDHSWRSGKPISTSDSHLKKHPKSPQSRHPAF